MLKHFTKFLVLVMLLGIIAPAFAQDTVIDSTNAFDLEEVVRLGRGNVVDAQFSPDGSQVIVASSIGIWVYDATALDTVTEPTFIAASQPPEMMVLSPDGEAVITGYDDIIQVWVDGEMAAEVDTDSFLTAIAISPDGSLVVSGHWDDTVKLWPDPTGDPIVLEGHTDSPNDFAFSPDGTILASGSEDDTVRLWDIVEGTELAVVEAGTDVNVIEFLPDGSAVVTGGSNGVVSVWDAASGELLIAFEEASHTSEIISMAVSPDGALVATGSWDDDVRVWDIAGGEQRSVGSGEDAEAWIQPEMDDTLGLSFSPDGSALLVAALGEYVAIYDIASRDVLATAVGYTEDMQAVDFNPDGSLMTFGDDDGDVYIWKVGSSDQITQIPHIEDLGSFSSDNELGLTYATDGSYIVLEGAFEVYQLDAETGETLNTLDVDGFANSVAVSPDSSLIAVATSDGLSVFNAESGLVVAQITSHTDDVNTLVFHPDQTMIATASDDGTIRIFGIPG